MAVFPRFSRHGVLRHGAIVTATAAAMTVLAGCSSAPAAPPSDTPTVSVSQPATKPSDTPSPVQVPTPTPKVTGTPVDMSCDDLVSLEAMYKFNPNFGKDPDYAPKPDTDAEKIVGYQGLACGWVNQSSGDKIEIAVARVDDPTALTDLKNAATMSSHLVPYQAADEGTGFFIITDDFGEAQAFSGPYWIIARSKVFLEPGEAESLVTAAIDALNK